MIKLLFPWLHSSHANRKVFEKIEKIKKGDIKDNLDYMNGFSSLTTKDVKEFYEQTLDVKKSLEDKLKTSLFSVTIGITVLTSAVTLLFNDGVSSLDAMIKGIIFFTGSVAIIYMILAGIFAIKTISGFISVFQLFPQDIANASDDTIKESIAICSELNSLSNIVRQNLMSVSFHCIINSLFVITLFFFLIGGASFIPGNKTDKPTKIDVILHSNQDGIYLMNSKINKIEESNKRNIELLDTKVDTQNTKTTKANISIERNKKLIDENRQRIDAFKIDAEKSSNNRFHPTPISGVPSHFTPRHPAYWRRVEPKR